MPRRPRRHHLSPRPVAFSSYGRSLTRFATAYALKHQICGPKYQEKPPSKSLGGNDHESDSSDEEVSEEEVHADFAFFDPKPDDFHGVKLLLQPYLDDKEWDISSFVDLILAQPTVGTVVKLENDEDNGSFAVVTALNLGRHKGSKCIMEVKDYLLKACQEGAVAKKLKVLLEDKAEHVGLLVSQRVMNLPLQLLPHLYDALFDEISWATEDEPTEELRKSFRFKHYLLISRIYKKKAKSRKTSSDKSENDIIYIKAEDELLIELSSWSFTFPLKSQQPGDQEVCVIHGTKQDNTEAQEQVLVFHGTTQLCLKWTKTRHNFVPTPTLAQACAKSVSYLALSSASHFNYTPQIMPTFFFCTYSANSGSAFVSLWSFAGGCINSFEILLCN